ncbi:alginate lyase family protein [Paraferrimonas sp. SM1919]|uniref:alginate lyase family protein n=1 Tax=Paraferrimonas sp. SM1919 TaxID=2662263 RepID=UPI0013D56FA4|nr:alginate lyase family protein [Paraferrimonas sp. SM1919]
MFKLNLITNSLVALTLASSIMAISASGFEQDQQVAQVVNGFTHKFESGQITAPIDISPKAILSLLDFSHPGLEKVKALADIGQEQQAMEALLAYFRAKYKDSDQISLDKYQREYAQLTLNHIIKGNKNYPPVFRGANIQWPDLAVIDGKTIHDKEFLYQYHRLHWWSWMAKAYQETQNEAYFDEWRYQLVSYTNELLPITKQTPWFIRRGMESYYRTLSATEAFRYFVHSPKFDVATLQYFLGFFHNQAEHIRTEYAKAGNHLLGELTQVFKNGAEWTEFTKSAEWRNEGLTRIPGLLDEQIYSDGMNKETVFSYHTMYAELFYGFYQALKQADMLDQVPAHYADTVKKMHDIKMVSLFPDGSTTQFGDAWKYRKEDGIYKPRYADWIYKTWSDRYPDEPHYKYLATDGKKGQLWQQTSFNYPESGFTFFKSDWSKDGIHLGLESASSQAWHAQPDTLTFSMGAYGRSFMVDSGAYIYESDDPEEKRLRKWFRDSRAHQTVTLDNKDVDQKPKHILWHDSDNLSVVVVDNQSYEDLKHRRSIIFVNKELFVVHDELSGEATGTVRAHYQFVPTTPVFSDNGLTVDSNFADGANLLVKTFDQTASDSWFSSLFGGESKLKMEQEEGWVSYLMNDKLERPAWAYAIDKTDAKDVAYLTALYPQKGQVSDDVKQALQVTVEKSADGVNVYQITTEKGIWQVEVDTANNKASLKL